MNRSFPPGASSRSDGFDPLTLKDVCRAGVFEVGFSVSLAISILRSPSDVCWKSSKAAMASFWSQLRIHGESWESEPARWIVTST